MKYRGSYFVYMLFIWRGVSRGIMPLSDWVYQSVSVSICHTNDELWLHTGGLQSDQSFWLHAGGAHTSENPNWIKIDNQRESSQHICVCMSCLW